MATKHKRPSEGGEPTKREFVESEPHRMHDLEQFEVAARRVTTALAQGNYDLARVALEAEIKQLEEEARRKPFFKTLLSEIGIEPKCLAYLEEELDVITIEDFLGQSVQKILAIRGMGEIRLLEAMQRVLAYSIKYIQE